jgi:insertion element IS1 protein InsB
MPWLLDFIDEIIGNLPEDLNAEVACQEEDELKVAKLEVDELWSFVGSKKNDQWLWLVLHKKSRQVLAMQVGPRDKKTAELLFAKLPESLKKKPSISLISLMSTMKLFLGVNTNQLANNLVRQATLKDLIVHSDKDVRDL